MTQGQKPFWVFFGASSISGTIPANISTPVALSSSLMMEGSQPPLRETCFHVISETDEICLEDLNSLFGRLKLYLSSPRNKAQLGNLACVMPTDLLSEGSSLDGLCSLKNLQSPQQLTDPTAPTRQDSKKASPS